MEKIIQSFLENLTTRNLDNLCNLFAENIDWLIPGDQERASWLGQRKNKEQIKSFFEELWRNTEPLNANINNILNKENVAIISGEFQTKMLKTGKIVDSLFFIELTTENNKIVKYRLLEDSFAVSKALTQK
ncbi:nuclear transport factor 2 family protein [Sphingobacterium arenae]|uniref:Nuclear transport factor 2 family protein n=1 Tax=Sphingobacterium arenae TaxID=1280598 RepID=A0ABR7Y3F3_9SPHI|nr:nuclear transport factor 2 family protein [Sphingobacterium arenae]MBD1425828.1 nuclear transport factor 2 family protein [Sphingobacterium arenae]